LHPKNGAQEFYIRNVKECKKQFRMHVHKKINNNENNGRNPFLELSTPEQKVLGLIASDQRSSQEHIAN